MTVKFYSEIIRAFTLIAYYCGRNYGNINRKEITMLKSTAVDSFQKGDHFRAAYIYIRVRGRSRNFVDREMSQPRADINNSSKSELQSTGEKEIAIVASSLQNRDLFCERFTALEKIRLPPRVFRSIFRVCARNRAATDNAGSRLGSPVECCCLNLQVDARRICRMHGQTYFTRSRDCTQVVRDGNTKRQKCYECTQITYMFSNLYVH